MSPAQIKSINDAAEFIEKIAADTKANVSLGTGANAPIQEGYEDVAIEVQYQRDLAAALRSLIK